MRTRNKGFALLLCLALLLSPAAADDPGPIEADEPAPIIVVEEEPVPTPEPAAPAEETAAPSPTPRPTPTRSPGAGPALALTVDGAAEDEESHVWYLTLPADGQLVLRWTLSGAEAELCRFAMTGENSTLTGETDTGELAILAEELTSGRYTLTTEAVWTDGSASAELILDLTISGEDGPAPTTPGPTGTITPGWRPRVTPGKGAARSAPTPTPNRYTKIKPGKALLSSHASGSGLDGRNTADGLSVSRIDGVSTLKLDGVSTGLTCGDASFIVRQTGDLLELVTEAASPDWRLTLRTLDTLADAGVRILALVSPEGQRRLNARQNLRGAVYTRERMDGYVPEDFVYRWADGGWTVEVEDRRYTLARGRLVRLTP